MLEDKTLILEKHKQAAIQAIQDISQTRIQELVCFHNPPPVILTVLQYVQIILAGNYHEIEVNPATKQAIKNDWSSCRKMVGKDTCSFLKACVFIFDLFQDDKYLD
jgi:hypothetical protein